MFKELTELKRNISSNLSEILELRTALKHKDLETQDSAKQFFLDIIDVIDSFENKESSMLEKYSDNNEYTKIVRSYIVIKKRLLNLLAKYGVTQVDFPDSKLIVGFSKVVGTEPDPARKDDAIISVVRNGYIKGHEVIREAELIVVKN